jgi:hypothetical protein
MDILDKAKNDSTNKPEFSGPARHKFRKADGIIILVLLLLGAFHIAAFQRIESFGFDSSTYVTLAHNLLETGRYEFNYRPHTLYPPGFPALLAFISMLIGSSSYSVFVRFMAVFSTMALIVWFFVLRQYVGRLAAGASCLLVATSGPLLQMATQQVLSEPPFFLVSGLVLLCLTGLERYHKHRSSPRMLLLSALFFTVAAILIRSAGVALCAGMLFWTVASRWGRGPRRPITFRTALASAALGFLTFALWTVWSERSQRLDYRAEYMKSYASQFMMKDPHRPGLGKASAGQLVLRMASNAPVQSSHIAALLTRISWVNPIWYSPLTVITFILLLSGLIHSMHDRLGTLFAGYFMAYFAVYLLWPFDEGPRFMLPVSPLAFVFVWSGLIAIRESMRRRPVITSGFFSMLGAAIAAGTATQHMSGFQARASMAFWVAFTVVFLILTILARRAGLGNIAAKLLAPIRTIPAQVLKGVVVALCAVGIFQQIAISRTILEPDASQFAHYPSADCALWLRTAGDGVVMAGQAEILHRLTGRRVASFPITSDAQVIVATVRRENVRYLVVYDPAKYEYFFPIEEERYRQIERAYPGMFELVHKGPRYSVFERRSIEGR